MTQNNEPATVVNLEQRARTRLFSLLNPEEHLDEQDEENARMLIDEIANEYTPEDTQTVLELALDELWLAADGPEIGVCPDDTPHTLLRANINEHLIYILTEAWKSWAEEKRREQEDEEEEEDEDGE